MGGSKSKPAEQAPSTVWNPQTSYLQDIYSQAQNTYRQQSGQSYTPGGMATRQVANPAYQQWQQGQQSFGNQSLIMDGYDNPNFMMRGGQGGYGQSQPAPSQFIDQQYQQEGSWGTDPNYVDPAQTYLNQWGDQLRMSGQQFGQANQGLLQGMGILGQANAGAQQGYGVLGQANAGVQQGYGALGDARGGFNSFMNPGENPASAMYARLAGQQFNEQIMPGLKGDAMVAGGLGNSRAGIAQGLAGARVGQQLQDWNAQLYNEDMNRKLQASQGLSGLGGQYGQLAGQQTQIGNAYGQLAGTQGNIGGQYGQLAGLQGQLGEAYGQLGGQYGNLANAQQSLPWMALNQYRNAIGQPTVMSGGGTGATQGSAGWGGTVASLAGLALAPATGGASLLAAGAVNQGLNSYYK